MEAQGREQLIQFLATEKRKREIQESQTNGLPQNNLQRPELDISALNPPKFDFMSKTIHFSLNFIVIQDTVHDKTLFSLLESLLDV